MVGEVAGVIVSRKLGNRDSMIQQHNGLVAYEHKKRAEGHRGFAQYKLRGPATLPGAGRTLPDTASLMPVLVSELRVRKVHYGRMLRAKVIVEPNNIGSVFSILEDEKGDVIYLIIADPKKAEPLLKNGLLAKVRMGPKIELSCMPITAYIEYRRVLT